MFAVWAANPTIGIEMSDEIAARPLHLHTIESLSADLVSGRAVGVGSENTDFKLQSEVSRSILEWYRVNRGEWAGNVAARDIDAIVHAIEVDPPDVSAIAATSESTNRQLELVKIEAHRFGGLHAYGTSDEAPENFVFKPGQAITIFEGWNGSGKTSLLNAVIWCLTGQLLRPQRKPEEADAEFECRVERGTPEAPSESTYHTLTPVTPLPDPGRFVPDPSDAQLPLDTWVELTFADEAGVELTPVRRTQGRTPRGKLDETPPDLTELGVDPIAIRIGTTMPGLIPFIQIGSVSELGVAVAELTGLSDLVDLSKHATKVKQRLDSQFRKERDGEIEDQDRAFCQAREDLSTQLQENPDIGPSYALPIPSDDPKLEVELRTLEDHFVSCKSRVLEDAKSVLGDTFDSNDKSARDDLENNIGSARGQLQQLGQLPSASRLAALAALTEEQLDAAAESSEKIKVECRVLAELISTPVLARRKQLYARVAEWITDHEHSDLNSCAVCSSPLDDAIDHETGRLVREHISEALTEESELLGKTISSWSDSRLARITKALPEALRSESQKDLPAHPGDLIGSAICIELFDTQPFKGSLAVLQANADQVCQAKIRGLPPFTEPDSRALSQMIGENAADIDLAVRRLDRAVAFARWRIEHGDAVKDLAAATIGTKVGKSEAVCATSPLGAKIATLESVVKSVGPINAAITLCGRMANALKIRRISENRIVACDKTIVGIGEVIALGGLAEKQVEGLRIRLQSRAAHWRDRFYNNAYASAGHDLIDTDMDSKGTLNILFGSNGIAAPAQHIANASALRASLTGFFLAFWEHVLETRGGLKLLILDDPQELLDGDNKDRLARSLPEFVDAGAQMLVTTHDRDFARKAVAEARKLHLVEHWSVHPVNTVRSTLEIAPAVDELNLKQRIFEQCVDDAAKAQDYASEARIFIEARLADLFDDPAYPSYSSTTKAPTLAAHLGRLRGLVKAAPNDLFRSSAVTSFCADPALKDGADCITLLNTAHHKDKKSVTYKQVYDVRGDLNRLRKNVEKLHEEFRRWRWRDPSPEKAAEIVPLKAAVWPTLSVPVYPDLAAFTGASPVAASQSTDSETFDASWFDDKALYYVRNDNLGFAAPSGSLVVVECDPKPGNDRNLVIALKGERVYARRLFRKPTDFETIALAAETPDSRKSPPSILARPSEFQIHRILGVLFDESPPPVGKEEAVQVEDAMGLSNIEIAFRVREESALPLALPGQLVLGGPCITPADMDRNEGRLVAIVLEDGAGVFKRIGPNLPGAMAPLRQFESIGGLGSSEVIAMEFVEGQFEGVPVMAYARIILGVLYEG